MKKYFPNLFKFFIIPSFCAVCFLALVYCYSPDSLFLFYHTKKTLVSDYFITFTFMYILVCYLFLDTLDNLGDYDIKRYCRILFYIYVNFLAFALIYAPAIIFSGIGKRYDVDETLGMFFVSIYAGIISGSLIAIFRITVKKDNGKKKNKKDKEKTKK